jgi:DNA ligase 1
MIVRMLLVLCCCLSPFASAAATPPRLMLPTVYRGGIDVRQYWVSEKLDGVRGRWDGHRLWARSGEPIDPPPWFTARWPAQPMDGELWIGRGRFEQVSTLVRATAMGGAAWRQVHFMVFDLPGDGGRFEHGSTPPACHGCARSRSSVWRARRNSTRS